MARIPQLPPYNAILNLRGTIDFACTRGVLYVRSWPRRPNMPRSLPSQTSAQDFAAFSRAIQSVDPITKNEALDNTAGTNWTWKDILTSAAYGGVIRW